ncbi:MAG: M48 family metallopeptidase [Elusimicrobia bacterium]|nr:M48 family metallopeptidase [Elusimicrobiota bacterium]
MESLGGSVIREVKDFLRELRTELPGLFDTRPRQPGPGLESPLREKARSLFTERVDYWRRRMGVSVGRIRIKDQRTLWGSCSNSGNLNFNWRASLAPIEVVDYLVIHELSHLFEMNHSPRFWRRVESWCPDWRRHRRWLLDNGPRLKATS